MLRFLCCCCFSGDSSGNERQPLLHPTAPSQVNGAESARKARPAHSDANTVKRIGRLAMRRVNVPELDRRFIDMAETFNEQQERYEAMFRHIRNLQQSFDSTSIDNLAFAACVRKIREEQKATYRVSLKMKGYDFSLSFVPVDLEGEKEEKPLPPNLRLAENEVKGISESAKATISKGATLQELIGWLLRSQDQMVEQVKEAAETYQEQGRLNENLQENIREVKRAKELSQGYRQQAGKILTEAAEIAGAHL
ncbi:uncharacterized protein si:ch73-345f18.3 [Melanotaenia boesemani]|uniref:uncharacterized protein si:ch73-345f18.3 n=1 Tax=Melanotaenia boesemani TaxID=1250792 RepID=UPI001C04FAA5|nr:uncharacterized protein si:ch73-345f18.3 [Melanotaenia boesemani]